MKITITNFGPIKKFEIDLAKDLFMIYGKNNIGKSYAMSVVYLIIKHFSSFSDHSEPFFIRREMESDNSDLKKGNARINHSDPTNEMKRIMTIFLNKTVMENLENSFINTFGDLKGLKNYKSGKTAAIRLTLPDYTIQIDIGKKIQAKITSAKTVTWEMIEKNQPHDHERLNRQRSPFDTGVPLPDDPFYRFVSTTIREMVDAIREKIGGLYFLPASRSGLYTGAQSFFPILTELSKRRGYLTKKLELPAMSEPIADYILRLSEIRPFDKIKNRFQDIAKLIEEKILKGKVEVDLKRNQLIYSPIDSNLTLFMSNSSSMVSEISPIVVFLKYVLARHPIYSRGIRPSPKKELLKTKPLIFIEEPEAHLHPEAQVQITEMFVELVKAGVKLIITSHSNYMFNKLNNLVIGKAFDFDMYTPLFLKDTAGGSVGKEMELDDLGVEDENFIDTADALYEEREQILDRLNTAADDK
jgi:hypothetical protein